MWSDAKIGQETAVMCEHIFQHLKFIRISSHGCLGENLNMATKSG